MAEDLALFRLALLFGAGVIAFFAWSQFNRPSFEASRELERLIRFLKPSDLRKTGIFRRAFLAYAAILLLIYVLVCSYFTLPMLGAIGWVAPKGVESAQSPVVPLMIALAMVGIAPSFPILQQLEEKIRFAAHHLSGIPTRLVHGCQQLQKQPLGLPRDGSGLLLPEADWKRLAHYRRIGDLVLDDPADFAEDIAKVIAYRAWILKHRLGSAGAPRPGIDRNDADLKGRIDRLLSGLDILSGFRAGEGHANGEPSREAWEELAAEADLLAADVCAMLMLRLEHGLIRTGGEAEGRDDAAQAEALLAAFVDGAGRWADHSALVGRLWLRATLVTLVLTFFWGVFVGPTEAAIAPGELVAVQLGASYALTALLTYSVAIFMALALHDRALRAPDPDARWPNMALTHFTGWMGPAAVIFALAALAAVLGVVAISVFRTTLAQAFAIDASYWTLMRGALYAEGPRTVLGPVLALGIVASIDAQQAGEAAGRRSRWIAFGATIGAMMVLAPALQALAIQYRDVLNFGGCLAGIENRPDLDAAFCERFRFTTWGSLVEREARGLMLVTLRAAIIGSAVLWICQATLAAEARGRARRERRRAAPAAVAREAGGV